MYTTYTTGISHLTLLPREWSSTGSLYELCDDASSWYHYLFDILVLHQQIHHQYGKRGELHSDFLFIFCQGPILTKQMAVITKIFTILWLISISVTLLLKIRLHEMRFLAFLSLNNWIILYFTWKHPSINIIQGLFEQWIHVHLRRWTRSMNGRHYYKCNECVIWP